MTQAPAETATLPMAIVWRFTATALVAAIAFALIIPLAVITLADRGYSTVAIGVFAMLPYGLLVLAMPLTAQMRRWLGRGATLRLSLGLGLVQMAGFVVTDSYVFWCLFAAIGGLKAAILWGLNDTLIAENAPPDRVGHVAGLYQTLLAGALMLGPALPVTFGLDFRTGSVVALALMVAAYAPVVTLSPRVFDHGANTDAGTSVLPMIFAAPGLIGAALLGGLFESGVSAMAALHALDLGYAGTTAALVVTVIAGGSLLVQYPLGRLADRVPLRPLLLGSGLVLFLTSALLPLTATLPSLIWGIVAIWGAIGGGLYTLIMVHIAGTYRGTGVAAATIAAMMAYTFGGLIGPGLGGVAMDMSADYGLTALLLALSLVLTVVIAWGPDMRSGRHTAKPHSNGE